MHLFISAGEPSGDLHGSNLIRSLRRRRPDLDCYGFGGEHMTAAGCRIHYPLCDLAGMGVLGILSAIPKVPGVLAAADPRASVARKRNAGGTGRVDEQIAFLEQESRRARETAAGVPRLDQLLGELKEASL